MLTRIVKLTFRPEAVDGFICEVFEQSKDQIRAFPGCVKMSLLRHNEQPNVLFTISNWENEAALEAYRQSDLFKGTWARTKALFAEKAEAWSLEMLDQPM